jgi:hypothetical protein
MSVIAAGSLIAASGAPAAARPASARIHPMSITGFGAATVTPDKNLVNNQVVTIKASKFPAATTTLYAAECAAAAVAKVSEDYCDTTVAHVATAPATNGAATIKFTIHTGTAFTPTKSGKCQFPLLCYIIISDGPTLDTTTTVAFPSVKFKDTRAGTVTKVTAAHKTITAGRTLKITSRTIRSKILGPLTGTVTFYDNGKKFKTVKATAGGRVTASKKFVKAGKQHITVKYSGNKVYKNSLGKLTIVVKKKKK